MRQNKREDIKEREREREEEIIHTYKSKDNMAKETEQK